MIRIEKKSIIKVRELIQAKKYKAVILLGICSLLLCGSNFTKTIESDVLEESVSIYIDDVLAEAVPSKEDNVVFDENSSNCNNGATIRWDYEEWGPVILNGTKTKTKCNLRFKTGYKESLLNGTDPVLKDELIPVTLENDGTVRVADLGSEWYKYESQRWANAIILKDESTRNHYKANDVIKEKDIESYFVWIPRYRYKIFNEGLDANVVNENVENKAKTIEVIFENNMTPISNGSKVGEWLTHPAFTSFNNNGMWVGKFETSKGNTNPDNSINPSGVEIKPNVSSWRNINVAIAFYTSYNYKRNLESHMMKNTEWGAVAYLQHSTYGSHVNVRINNHSDYITGYAANTEPTCDYTKKNLECNKTCNDGTCNEPYNTSIGKLASTTGNITGIYDMSGGAWEYVMGFMINQNGKIISGKNSLENSGFNGELGCPTCEGDNSGITSIENGYYLVDERYYDTYRYHLNAADFSAGKLGDATKEMSPFAYTTNKEHNIASSWYGSWASFIIPSFPWLVRSSGYDIGSLSGIFTFIFSAGNEASNSSYRIALSLCI